MGVKYIGTSIFQILSVLFVVAFLLGILNLHFSDRTNYCDMTFMFEYPQFVRISVPENADHPQYGLFAYSEGRYTEKARKMWFDGIPVLYLPGNAGSHMQARSIASVALRKAISKGYDYHFDFFTISYNEELSGLYGGVLQSQTLFASACIERILSLYKNNKYTKTVPQSVILIGHSMGGVIAKRLMAYPKTFNTTNIVITLAAPLQSPIINYDPAIDDYYKISSLEWDRYINWDESVKERKVLISLGSGPRDRLVPSSLTSGNESTISSLTTSIPGVWTSPDHVSIVWCKQLVLVINRYLSSIVDMRSNQITNNFKLWRDNAVKFFTTNRSMHLNPQITRQEALLIPDAFWYEDNRRIYQVSRPEIMKMTYLMIRLVSFPQNRFVAIQSVNISDKDWLYGCNAKYVYGSHRYCKQGIPLNELSRWSGAAKNFGRRKLATINLHDLTEAYPDWTHVVVKVPPTKKAVTLTVDINDYRSRVINVDLPSHFSLGKHLIKNSTEPDSLYYELVLNGFDNVHQSYLLYVEPNTCKSSQYHVSAEFHAPWAENYEYYHYFTHLKRTPMKLRLFKSNPNITLGLETLEHAKITLLLDPQCTYSISISSAWYHRLAQMTRNYSFVLYAYIAGILLLVARTNILSLKDNGSCLSMHSALMSENVKPYYVLPFARLGIMAFTSIPYLNLIFEPSTWKNLELQYFVRSLLVLPIYMTALGILNVLALIVLGIMVSSSQIAHRLLFRMMWRGGSSLAEKVASGLQKVPLIVSAALVCAAPISCGAASLAAGTAFYAFMLSKMYEEYLEDYCYKLLAKIGSKICYFFKRNQPVVPENEDTQNLLAITNTNNEITSENEITTSENEITTSKNEITTSLKEITTSENKITSEKDSITENKLENLYNSAKDTLETERKDSLTKLDAIVENNSIGSKKEGDCHRNVDEDLNNLNFHMLMFFLWLTVTLANTPALLTWARNFKYSMLLKRDTSFTTGLIMSVCSSTIWQINGPRPNLKYYEAVSSLLFTMAIFILTLGPFSVAVVNYGVTFMFAVITVQQLCDKEVASESKDPSESETKELSTDNANADLGNDEKNKDNLNSCSSNNEKRNDSSKGNTDESAKDNSTSDSCDVCNESRIYNTFKSIKEKLGFNEDI